MRAAHNRRGCSAWIVQRLGLAAPWPQKQNARAATRGRPAREPADAGMRAGTHVSGSCHMSCISSSFSLKYSCAGRATLHSPSAETCTAGFGALMALVLATVSEDAPRSMLNRDPQTCREHRSGPGSEFRPEINAQASGPDDALCSRVVRNRSGRARPQRAGVVEVRALNSAVFGPTFRALPRSGLRAGPSRSIGRPLQKTRRPKCTQGTDAQKTNNYAAHGAKSQPRVIDRAKWVS